MDNFNHTYYLETPALNKIAEQFPSTESLLPLVLQRYASISAKDDPEQALKLPDILEYLHNTNTSQLDPLEAIIAQTEAIGDPGLPSSEQQAIMKWLAVAFSHWEIHYPIEPPLASEFRKLLPVATILAITQPKFLTPGAHGFHSFMDAAQDSLVGWQSNLGRAGENLENKFLEAIAKAGEWLSVYSVDVNTIFKDAQAIAEKNYSRSGRLAQRVVETELGRLKILEAKVQAAQMINDLLAKYPVPDDMAEFLKGHWYESLQLVWLRFGSDSTEWNKVSNTTKVLLDTLQSEVQPAASEEQAGSRRQQVFEVISELPGQVKQWLFSLQHDYQSIDQVVLLIERTYASVLRQQDLQLELVDPIPTDVPINAAPSPRLRKVIDQQKIGQWYMLAPGKAKGRPSRLQLVHKIEAGQQLLFTNHAGIKARQENYADFATGLEAGQYQPLSSGHSFCQSLIHAANYSTADAPPVTPEDPEVEDNAGEKNEPAGPDHDETESQEQLSKEYEAAIAAKREREKSRNSRRKQREANQRKLQQERDDKFLSEQAEAQRALRQKAEAQRIERDREAAEALRKEEYMERKRERDRTRQALLGAGIARPVKRKVPQAPMSTETEELHLLTGTWLSFFDGETPMLAKLASHDPQGDIYTFVDRSGMKLRESSHQELVSLLDSDQVKIIEAHSTFRKEVIRKQNNDKD